MIKRFEFHWKDGAVNYAFAESVEDASKVLGLSGGVMRALDYWDSRDEIPYEERQLLHEGGEIINPVFVEQIKNLGQLQVGANIIVKAYNREYPLIVTSVTGCVINLETLKRAG